MEENTFACLPGALLPWYDKGHRELPWRQDRDPYHIWLSEIMLQQTRVEAVRGYYNRFLEDIPTIRDLAACDDDALHKLWEGLGYYSRVRNLKKAALEILEKHGSFPADYDSVLALPGIGEYTAGAICSIAFDLPTPAVDGNVLRLIARLTDDNTPIDLPAYKKTVRQRLAQVYPQRAGDFTQSLIELGATLCGPNREPVCEECPCKGFCKGYQRGSAAALPRRMPKSKRREEELTVFVMRCDGQWALRKRPDKGLLAGLWEFPNVNGKLALSEALNMAGELGVNVREIRAQLEKKHIFTHIEWHMRGLYLEVSNRPDGLCWMEPEQIDRLAALPTAFRQFWEEIDRV